MSIVPQQDIWYGIVIKERQDYNALVDFWERHDDDLETLVEAVEDFAKKFGLEYHLIGYDSEDGIIIGKQIVSWGDFEVEKVSFSNLAIKEAEAKCLLTPEVVRAIQEFLGTQQEPQTWTISYMF
jgi:hypothetical protein